MSDLGPESDRPMPPGREPAPAFTVRRAGPADLDRLGELALALQDCLEAANPDLWQMTAEGRAGLPGQWAARLLAPDGCALVAVHPSEGPIGMIYGRIVSNSRAVPSRAGSIEQLYVTPSHRRAGAGSRLVAALCRFFAAAGVEELSLRYVSGNREAAAFWTALGLRPRIIVAGAPLSAVASRLLPMDR